MTGMSVEERSLIVKESAISGFNTTETVFFHIENQQNGGRDNVFEHAELEPSVNEDSSEKLARSF